ncbi:MAG TPA: BatA domain-containing protein, partial [Fimbriiglobus sp.]|nr:BatA domain-containing protein [Fimbriiglobus sp.]
AAVAVPVILHFFYKARYRRLPWAAMTFLRQAVEQTSRRLRFQEWILLALRCLLLLLLAFALARPTLRALTAGGRGESIDAVFVFDTSYSMGARDGEKSRLDRAKEAALRVIDDLPANSTVQVYACSDRVTHLGPVTPGNLDQARQVVQNVELSSLTGDILPGLNEAFAALDRGAGANKEVYLFGDLQKAGWDRQAGAVRAKAAEIKQRATLVVVRCGSPDRSVNNVAVADITYPGGIPHTDSRLPVTVLLKNTGKAPVRNLSVTLEVDGRQQEKESGSVEVIEPGQAYPVTLTAKLDEAGPRLLTARVQGDDLPGDNTLDRLIPVRDRIQVLIVDGTPDVRDPKQSGSHFLRNALLPVPENRLDEYHVRVTVAPPEEAGPGLLGVTDVCFLCNVPASDGDRPGVLGLSKEFIDRLVKFVKDGGGLVIAAGDNVVPQRYNAILGAAGAGLLPFDLDEPATTKPEQPFKPAPDSADAVSFLARFRDEPFRTVTADVDVAKMIGVREIGSGGRVLMRLTDQKPLLASRLLGNGEVVFVGTALDASWSNWPARAGSYLSFVQLTLSHLTGKATSGVNRTAGEPLVWYPPEAPRGFELLRPDNRRVKLGKAQGGNSGQKRTVTAPDTTVAGVYRIGLEGEDPPSGPRFAVAPDLRETETLDSLTDAEAEEVLGFKPVLLLAGTDAEGTIAAERGRREWTVWVLLLVFAAAVAEAGWAWFCGKAW